MRHYPPRPSGTNRYGGYSSNRDYAAHMRFARAVKKRDGYRCVDCGSTRNLRACHLDPISGGNNYNPDRGVTRCRTCDKATDPQAR